MTVLLRRHIKTVAASALVVLALASLANCGGGGGGGSTGDEMTIRPRLPGPDLRAGGFGLESDDQLFTNIPQSFNYETFTGVQFGFRGRIFNIGDEKSPSTTLSYYRSTDRSFSESTTEKLSGSTPVGEIEPGAELHISAKSVITIQSPGKHHYRACIDPVTGETNTNNNCTGGASRVTVKSSGTDLVLGNAKVNRRTYRASTSAAHDTVEYSLSVSIQNRGRTASTATLYWYGSSSYVTSVPSDLNANKFGSEVSLSSLALNESTTKSTVIASAESNLNLNIGDKHYSVCVVADGDIDTSNNCVGIARVFCGTTRFGGKGVRVARVIGGAQEYVEGCN